MMRHRYASIFLLILLTLVAATDLTAQRRVTPVAPPAGRNETVKEDEFDKSRLKEIIDSKGNIVLIDTVSGSEYNDTTILPRVIGMIYPKIHSLTIGVNLWDGVMRALGQQHYGLGSVRATLSIHNRYMPMLELGLSMAKDHPDGRNFTFRSPLAPYMKLGFSYNIFYNSNPDYQLTAGIRYCLTNFSYTVDNVTVDEGYWNDPSNFSIPSQRVTTGYFEAGLSLKVRIGGPISLGWDLLWRGHLHESRTPYGPPMIIPGFGKRESRFGANISIMYTLPLSRPTAEPSDSD